MSAVGRNSVTAIAEQTSKSAGADTLQKLRATSNSMEQTVDTAQSEALLGKRFTDDQFTTGMSADGSIDAEVDTDTTIGLILKHAIGAEDSAPLDINTDATFYRHIFTPSQDVDLAGWLTVMKILLGTDNYWEKYVDCRINQFNLDITSQSVVTIGLDLLGISSSDGSGSATETIDDESQTKLFAWEAGISWGGSDIKAIVDDASISHNNNIDDADYGLAIERRTLDPQDGDHTVEMTLQFSATEYDGLKDDLVAGNSIAANLTLGSTNADADPVLKFDYPALKLQTVSAPVSGAGKITVSITATAIWDSVAGYNVAVELVDETGTQY